MGEIVTDISFDDWVRYLFDHPVTEPAWHWDSDSPFVDLPSAKFVSYVTELFKNSGDLLQGYSDAQLNQAFWYLAGSGSCDFVALLDLTVPEAKRIDCIRSIESVFRQCFAVRCTPHLSHCDERGCGPLNSVCYMWWDIFPIAGDPENPAQAAIDSALMRVMENTLDVPSIPVQESALHGLGHWHLEYPAKCEGLVSNFERQHRNSRPDLLAYARLAKRGMIQ